MDSQNQEWEMVASWMASTKAFLFDFDGTLARLNIDFQALRLEVLALAQDFGIQEPLLSGPALSPGTCRGLKRRVGRPRTWSSRRFPRSFSGLNRGQGMGGRLPGEPLSLHPPGFSRPASGELPSRYSDPQFGSFGPSGFPGYRSILSPLFAPRSRTPA